MTNTSECLTKTPESSISAAAKAAFVPASDTVVTANRVKLGDEMNSFDAEAVVASPQEAAEWLRANAVRRYPAIEFARSFPRPASDY